MSEFVGEFVGHLPGAKSFARFYRGIHSFIRSFVRCVFRAVSGSASLAPGEPANAADVSFRFVKFAPFPGFFRLTRIPIRYGRPGCPICFLSLLIPRKLGTDVRYRM